MAEPRRSRSPFLPFIVGIIVIALALVAIFVVVPAVTGSSSDDSGYDTARAEYSEAWDALQTEMGAADAVLTAPGDADTALLEELRTAFNAGAALTPLDALADEHRSDPDIQEEATNEHVMATEKVRSVTASISTAREQVEAAVEGVASGEARPQLVAAIAMADATLARSSGRVPEEVRTTLEGALTDARATDADTAAASSDLTASLTALTAARLAVNDAIEPAASDANGQWCLHFEQDRCVSVDGASIVDSVYGGADLQEDLVLGSDGCFSAQMVDPNFQKATFAYCPPGKTPATGTETFVNPDYERIYIMGTPSADPWFRSTQIAAATTTIP